MSSQIFPHPELMYLKKGVSNRNKGLEWIMEYGEDDAVAYFADDDNTYDIRLFNEVSLFRAIVRNFNPWVPNFFIP